MATVTRPVTTEKSAVAVVVDWLTTVDHKKIGKMYLVLNMLFFVLAGVMALLIRTQLAWSNLKLIDPNRYNELFTMHGTSMIFLVIVPIWAGFANYILPLQIGARDMAFPRLNAFSFWLLLFSGLVMFLSYVFGAVPNGGWTAYPPLTGPTYTPGPNIDFWILGLHLGGLSSLFGAINFIVTTLNLRAPGMKLLDVPMFTWSMFITSTMVLFSTPMLTVAITLLLADRHLPRERHRLQEFDLVSRHKQVRYEIVNKLFDSMLAEDPARRIQTANGILDQFNRVTMEFDMAINIPSQSLPQKCIYCGIGSYVGADHELDTCGNIQTFNLRQLEEKGRNPWRRTT